MTDFHRRDVLRTAAALPLAAVAGCAGVLGEDGEPPAYGDSVPRSGANDEDGAFFVHLRWTRLQEYDSTEKPDYADELPGSVELSLDGDAGTPPVAVDPLVAYPLGGLFVGALTLGFGLLPYGFADTLLGDVGDGYADEVTATPADGDGEATATGSEVSVDSVLLVDGVGVFEGSFDADAVVAASDGFEPAGERGDFDVYEGTGDGFFDTGDLAYAVADDTLVVLLDGAADLGAVLDAIEGDGDRLSATEDAAWALRTAGHGHVTLGAWGVDPDAATDGGEFGSRGDVIDVESVLDGADGLVSSLELGTASASARLGAAFPDGEAPSEADVGAEVGTSATEREVTVEDDRVTVTGSWSGSDDATSTATDTTG